MVRNIPLLPLIMSLLLLSMLSYGCNPTPNKLTGCVCTNPETHVNCDPTANHQAICSTIRNK